MFQTQEIGKRIAQRRKQQNLTQMALADQMGVSYQAVSNWERGNSMPDIGKLPELAQVLSISIDELLGQEPATAVVQHVLAGDAAEQVRSGEIEISEVAAAAPILTPQQTKELVAVAAEKSRDEERNISLEKIVELAPFLDDEFLETLALEAADGGAALSEMVAIAPFLSDRTLAKLVERAPVASLSEVVAIAPFLPNDALTQVVQRVQEYDAGQLPALAPFLPEEALEAMVEQLPEDQFATAAGLAPFLSDAALSRLAERMMQINPELIASIAPFLSDEALGKVAAELISSTPEMLAAIAPFLSQKSRREIVEGLLRNGSYDTVKDIAKFI